VRWTVLDPSACFNLEWKADWFVFDLEVDRFTDEGPMSRGKKATRVPGQFSDSYFFLQPLHQLPLASSNAGEPSFFTGAQGK